MKRLAALTLALIMLLSMGITASASFVREQNLTTNSKASTRSVGGIEGAAYLANSDGEVVIATDDGDQSVTTIAPGETVYFKIKTPQNHMVTLASAVSGVTITPTWNIGGEHISKIEIVHKKFIDPYETDYCYMLAVTAKNNQNLTNVQDAMGNIVLKKTSGTDSSAPSGQNSLAFTLDLRVFFTVGYEKGDFSEIPKKPMIYTSDGSSDMEFTFAAFDGATFSVNTRGQQAIALGVSDTPVSSLLTRYPDAYLSFFLGNGAKFNRRGSLFIPAESGSYLYTISSSNAITAATQTYSYDTGGFTIETDTLGRYLISDRRLSATGTTGSSTANSVIEAEGFTSTTEPGTGVIPSPYTTGNKINPGTGAKV